MADASGSKVVRTLRVRDTAWQTERGAYTSTGRLQGLERSGTCAEPAERGFSHTECASHFKRLAHPTIHFSNDPHHRIVRSPGFGRNQECCERSKNPV